MTFLDYTIGTAIGIVIGQFPTYFVQRYFFKKVMDKHLDRWEAKLRPNGFKTQNSDIIETR